MAGKSKKNKATSDSKKAGFMKLSLSYFDNTDHSLKTLRPKKHGMDLISEVIWRLSTTLSDM